MLERRTTHVSLQTGIAEGTDPLALQSGQLLAAQNVRWGKDGSAQKRAGITPVINNKWSNGALYPLNTGEGRLVANGDELLVLDGKDVVSYSPGQGLLGGGLYRCPAPVFSAETLKLVSPNASVISQACASYSSGGRDYVVVASATQATFFSSAGGNATAFLFDRNTGAPVGTTGLTAGSLNANTDIFCVHAITVGDLIVVSYARASTGNIYARTLNMATLAWSSEQTLATDNETYGGVRLTYDIKPLQGSTTQYVLAFLRSSTQLILVCRVTASTGVTAASVSVTGTSGWTYPPTGIGISAVSGSHTYITYGWDDNGGGGTDLYLARTNAAGTALDGSFPLQAGTAVGLASDGVFVYSSTSAVTSASATAPTLAYTICTGLPSPFGTEPWVATWVTYTIAVSGTTPGSRLANTHYRLISGFFVHDDRIHCVTQRDSGEFFGAVWADVKDASEYGGFNGLQQGTCVVATVHHTGLVLTGSDPVLLDTAVLFPAELAVSDGVATFRPSTQFVDSSLCFAVSSWATNQNRKHVNLVKLTTSDKYRYQPAKADDGVYLGGGLVCTYDGTSIYPVGFTYDPVWCRFGEDASSGGSGWSTSALYYWSVIWERIDRQGRVSRSSPDFGVKKSAATSTEAISSTAWATPTNANSTMKLVYPTPGEWWDMFAGIGTAGRNRAVLYTSVDDATNLKRYSTTPILAGIGLTASQNLTAPPVIPGDGEAQYTAGQPLGALPHVQPPALLGLVNYRNRLVGIDPSRRTLRFSKTLVVGEVAAFTLDFNIPVPFAAEALGVLDDKLVVFGKDRIGVLEGSGPDDRGLGEQFSDVVLVTTDRGCIEPRSVVQTPLGLIYQAANGIMLFSRSGNQEFIGRPVQDTLAAYPTITSAVVHPTETCVLLTCTDTGGSVGRRLVYDYRLDRWSVDVLAGGTAFLSQAVAGGTLYLLDSAGTVWAETPASYLDDAEWVEMRIWFAAERLGGLQGYQRIWKVAAIGQRFTDHALTIRLYGDDRSSPDQTRTFPYTTTALTGPLRCEIGRVRRALCRSLSVELYDAAPANPGTIGTGRGLSLSGVSMEVGVLGDLTRTAPNRRG
ncbi:MAG: hypothetical protein E6Q97_17060 [Desulfurellales bacterium]|nr:MAG: hypothetical protein E6Q97_17060 [Desulfurellales bacterium]